MLDERTIRMMAAVATLAGVPPLVLLAWRAWAHRIRVALPHWRNGVGLTSVAFVSLAWVSFAASLAGWSPPQTVFAVTVLEFVLSIGTLLAPVFAMTWRGSARLYALAASVLMIIGGQAIVYT